jgi:hypothetical protein
MRLLCTSLFVTLAACGGGEAARSVSIWSNGSPGCWGDAGDTCGTGGNRGKLVQFQGGGSGGKTVAVVDDVTGGVPSLQITASDASASFGFCVGSQSTNQCEQRDLRAFKGGHLQFDARLESASVTGITVTLFPSLAVQIPVASLGTNRFTHVSIPLTPDLFGSNGPGVTVLNVFQIAVTNSAPAANQPVLTLNDLKWTSD